MKNVISNDSHLLKEESGKLINALREKGINEDVIFEIHVGFEEALRNAMMHGNKFDISKKVTVEIEITDSFVRICVEDEGEGFDPEKIPDPTLDENLLKECGRGVYLLTHLMDSVEYKKNGRCVIMTKNFRSENKQGRG
ncbi:MAG: ATP-binding protein [Candidatus Omnitrophota bacterium]|nr:ATP-binding protein [Candidatus Omnitrophota bacterium]